MLKYTKERRNDITYKVCKIRIYPNQTQKRCITETLGACRYVYNLYLEYNQRHYEENEEFLSGYDFAKILTKIKKNEERYEWLRDISTKALKDAIMNAEKAYKAFFKKKRGRPPRFRSRKDPFQSFFFIRDNIHFYPNTPEKKNIIKLPILGYTCITEKSYLPNKRHVTSGRVIYQNGKYYVSFIYETDGTILEKEEVPGFGVDVGIKKYATVYQEDGTGFPIHSFLKNKAYRKINEKIKYYQRIISKKMEINYGYKLCKYLDTHKEEPSESYKNIMKGESYNTSNIKRLRRKVSKLYEKRTNYAKNKINNLVIRLVRVKPEYIAIENLSIKDMLENMGTHDLHNLITQSMFGYFKNRMIDVCRYYDIELRFPKDPYFASSKICCKCGTKKDLTLSDRVYVCDTCGLVIDRDYNAAVNLCFMEDYIIA